MDVFMYVHVREPYCHTRFPFVAVPAKVRNVRVYVYFPHRNSPTVSAQVVWDGLSTLDAGGVVEKYVITVRDSNGLLITTGNVTVRPEREREREREIEKQRETETERKIETVRDRESKERQRTKREGVRERESEIKR